MLYWNTVTDPLKKALRILMEAEELADFRLVGGTALSLQLGHRMSVDIDLFTDVLYGTVNFDVIDAFLFSKFEYIDTTFGILPGMGRSYSVGTNINNSVKLDIFYTTENYIQDHLLIDNVRMATIEEILAMKVDVILRGGRKKDFWDVHELLSKYSIDNMLSLHEQRSPYTHNRQLIIQNFSNFITADEDLEPICLKNKHWEFIKEDIEEAITKR